MYAVHHGNFRSASAAMQARVTAGRSCGRTTRTCGSAAVRSYLVTRRPAYPASASASPLASDAEHQHCRDQHGCRDRNSHFHTAHWRPPATTLHKVVKDTCGAVVRRFKKDSGSVASRAIGRSHALAYRSAPPAFRRFHRTLLPTKATKPPSGPLWLHEIKHDGFRLIARKDGKRVRLYIGFR